MQENSNQMLKKRNKTPIIGYHLTSNFNSLTPKPHPIFVSFDKTTRNGTAKTEFVL